MSAPADATDRARLRLRDGLRDGLRRAGARAGAPLLRAWAATMRSDIRGWDAVEAARAKGPIIITFWHGRFILLPFIYPHERPIGVMISPSADGDLIATVIEALGRRTIRGSARRGALAAMRTMRDRLRDGWDLGIAVDGPQGPAYRVKPGAVRLAQLSGAPLVPLVYATRRGVRLGSWDRFWVPGPFTRALFLWGEPQAIAADADPEVARLELETRMREMLATADAWAGREAPWAA